jgi:hypothetical protein
MVRDVNDGKPWSETDIKDLRHWLVWGESIEAAARLLLRSGTVEEVTRKATELGLRIKDEQGSR